MDPDSKVTKKFQNNKKLFFLEYLETCVKKNSSNSEHFDQKKNLIYFSTFTIFREEFVDI